MASRTRSLQMAFSCGDGYAHRWVCHLMMMMMKVEAAKIEADAKAEAAKAATEAAKETE